MNPIFPTSTTKPNDIHHPFVFVRFTFKRHPNPISRVLVSTPRPHHSEQNSVSCNLLFIQLTKSKRMTSPPQMTHKKVMKQSCVVRQCHASLNSSLDRKEQPTHFILVIARNVFREHREWGFPHQNNSPLGKPKNKTHVL